MNVNKRAKLGIIGCGSVVQRNYLPALKFYPEIELAYVSDINASASARVAAESGAKVAPLEQVRNECQIVVIATPPASHAELVEKFLSPGRTVICEKPFVGTRSEAEFLTQAAFDRNCRLFVAHFRRCFPSVRLGRALIASGVFGDVTVVSAYEGGRFSWQSESGYVYRDPFGGVLFDTGSHTLDMLLHIAGLDSGGLRVARADTQRDSPEPSHDMEAKVILDHKGRLIPGEFKFSRVRPNANKIRIECQNGFIEVPVGMADYVRVGSGDGRAVIVYAQDSYADLMDCFALQFREMFSADGGSTFAAANFVNLVAVLESLNG